MEMQITGMDEALAFATGMHERVANVGPALEVFMVECERDTQRAFASSTSVDGDPFRPLAPSTIAARARQGAMANKRTKSGRLTAGAQRRRAQVAINVTPLIDTGRLRGSMHWQVSANSIFWDVLGYGVPHITGDRKNILAQSPPQRNFSVFTLNGDTWELLPEKHARLIDLVNAYVVNGRAEATR
jgi:hypothetical protein